MGINVHGARALCFARKLGADFEATATIGRQRLSLPRRGLSEVLSSFGYEADESQIDAIFAKTDGYAETLLAHLGATNDHSFDVSPYEGATHLHDMNNEIPNEYKEQYSVVLDGGSLEHVFNFPVAIKNCMEMVKVGGHYISILPANNFFGHGFYQFSPELFFSVFCADNGFVVEAMIAFVDRPNHLWHSATPNATWYSVKNPIDVGERVTLTNGDPISLIIIAKKTARTAIFAITPQQSDYAARWRAKASEAPSMPRRRPFLIRLAKKLIPSTVRRTIRKAIERKPKPVAEGFDRRFFQPMDPRTSGVRY